MYIKILYPIFKAIEKFIQFIQKILSNMLQLDNIAMANNFILNVDLSIIVILKW
jgi:hypothetical protein